MGSLGGLTAPGRIARGGHRARVMPLCFIGPVFYWHFLGSQNLHACGSAECQHFNYMLVLAQVGFESLVLAGKFTARIFEGEKIEA